MRINYSNIILGKDIPINEKVKLHIPTIGELAEADNNDFNESTRIFTTSVREQFSGVPEQVDMIEEKFPTLWDMAFDDEMNALVGEAMFGENTTLLRQFLKSLSYWTKTSEDQYRALGNKKIISEELDWIIDVKTYTYLSNLIKAVTLTKPNKDFIAPKGVSNNPRKIQMWKNTYNGRLREAMKKKNVELGDQILQLEAFAPGYVSFRDIKDMTYYQFSNLLSVYTAKYSSEKQYQIYTSEKFDTKDMKLPDLSEEIKLIKFDEN
ncbi:hypothetical protein [Limosilactobacillus reuteri]|uniref:Uncharacterized protein n=1 Tax=Limosilactobacillus reuteri TaxID=1598 RepID=A0AAX2SS21_LIMRT|nr:hypothetical protein [Limosilactobacillus reuteri]TGB09680.1 hypothetical protein E5F87_09835 [Limosilactobacillus reuteri]